MSSKTTWTDRHLQRLFDNYNKTYWCGKLPQHAVRVGKLNDCFGECNYKKREIVVDIDAHQDDRGICATLLHEMTHAAAGFCGVDGHGYKFYAQTERLLRLGAPVDVGMSETPGLRILADVVPRRFHLARKAMERAEAARQRGVLRAAKNHPFRKFTVGHILNDFESAALEMTERAAVFCVGEKHGLLDVEGKPKSRRAARFIAKGRRAFRASRKNFLQTKKLEAAFGG